MWGAGRLLKTFQPSWVLENQEKREGRRQKQKPFKKTSQFSQKLFSTHSLASHDTSLRKLLAVEIYIYMCVCVCVCVCAYISIYMDRKEMGRREWKRGLETGETERERERTTERASWDFTAVCSLALSFYLVWEIIPFLRNWLSYLIFCKGSWQLKDCWTFLRFCTVTCFP